MRTVVSVCVLAGLLSAACDNSGNSTASTTAATPVAAALITDTFTGTLNVLGTNIHPFTVGQVGTVNATLTAVGPPATVFVGASPSGP